MRYSRYAMGGFVFALATAGLLIGLAIVGVGQAAGPSTSLALDSTIGDNSSTGVGTLNRCFDAASGGNYTVDLVVEGDGVADAVSADVTLEYTGTVTSHDVSQSLLNNEVPDVGGSAAVDPLLSDPHPDTDGDHREVIVNQAAVGSGGTASGSAGILARFQMTAPVAAEGALFRLSPFPTSIKDHLGQEISHHSHTGLLEIDSTPDGQCFLSTHVDIITPLSFSNSTGQSVSDLHFVFNAGFEAFVGLSQNAPGCSAPAINTSPASPAPQYTYSTDVIWPDACVDNGESVQFIVGSSTNATSVCFNWTIFGSPIGTPCNPPTPTPTLTPTPTGVQFHDAAIIRLRTVHSVRLAPGVPDNGNAVVVAQSLSDHTDPVSVYLAFNPPGSVGANPGGCSVFVPAASPAENAAQVYNWTSVVLSVPSVPLDPNQKVTLNGNVEFECANPAAVDGDNWQVLAIADVHGDDFTSCDTMSEAFGTACPPAVNEDDNEDANNTKLRPLPKVVSLGGATATPTLTPTPTSTPAPFIVNSTADGADADVGDGVCQTATPGDCTLRAAIEQSNASAGRQMIHFGIGSGPQTIMPGSPLPAITDEVDINGDTQPGYGGNPIIEIRGDDAGVATDGLSIGLVAFTPNLRVRSLSLTGFSGDGIEISSAAGAAIQIENNWIGVRPDFTLSGNSGHGVHATNSQQASIAIGTGGGGPGNRIEANGGAGVFVESSASKVVIRGNSISRNGALGIDLAPEGVTPNDFQDPDTGANDLQNFPVIGNAIWNPVQDFMEISGSLNSTPNTQFNLEFFMNGSQCGGGAPPPEGERLLISRQVLTDSNGDAPFSLSFPGGGSGNVTATATGPSGTSEFSECRQATFGTPTPTPSGTVTPTATR